MAIVQARLTSGSGLMAATVTTANWQWTQSANAIKSAMLVSLLARHCALVEGGSSERNMLMKKKHCSSMLM